MMIVIVYDDCDDGLVPVRGFVAYGITGSV